MLALVGWFVLSFFGTVLWVCFCLFLFATSFFFIWYTVYLCYPNLYYPTHLVPPESGVAVISDSICICSFSSPFFFFFCLSVGGFLEIFV